jgi:hypothetical protein
MTIHGQSMLARLQAEMGESTRQIGRYFCIPAAPSNALRVLHDSTFTQVKIRDVFYAREGKDLEPAVDDQMQGVSFNVIDAVEEEQDFNSSYEAIRYSDHGDPDIFDCSKAERAIHFIRTHIEQGHPVIVSTWRIPWEAGILQPQCCHMWLALAYDDNPMLCFVHDSASNQIVQVPFYLTVPLVIRNQRVDLEIGLRGRITHTDYCCCAIKKK